MRFDVSNALSFEKKAPIQTPAVRPDGSCVPRRHDGSGVEPTDTTSADGSYSLGGTAETLRGEIVLDPSAQSCVDDIGPCVDSYTGLCQRTALVGTGIATSMSWATDTDLEYDDPEVEA